MFKNIYGQFNSVTDFVTRLDFWARLALSIISSGAIAYMWDMLLFAGILIFTFAMIAFIEIWLRSNRNKIHNKEENISPEYLSLKEAASLLAETTQFTTDKLQWASRFPGRKTMQEMFWERDNPSKVHKETLDSATTIPLINLCLHMCRKINVEICGTRPSFSKREIIPYEEIKYFDTDYKKLYSHIAREGASLIYNNVEIMKEDLAHAISKANFDALIAEINN